ncbi:hypothetical protein AVEN_35515-1 [Araneus ventricosus]|uniref:Uncharacterized protein n=1 Tax=Araneus ventricosus TaxID=182803 RepID=A0A4Y2GR37_ARAVE|nr:hypothetical protein AVEN_35515-1 [Araneus ventricosus]
MGSPQNLRPTVFFCSKMRKESERGRRNLWTRGVEAIPVVMATPAHSNGPGMEDISMGHRRRGNIRAMSVLFERLFLRPGSVLSHCNAQELRVGTVAGWEANILPESNGRLYVSRVCHFGRSFCREKYRQLRYFG